MNFQELMEELRTMSSHLEPLEAPLESLYQQPAHALVDIFYDVMATIRIIWKHSSHYHKP